MDACHSSRIRTLSCNSNGLRNLKAEIIVPSFPNGMKYRWLIRLQAILPSPKMHPSLSKMFLDSWELASTKIDHQLPRWTGPHTSSRATQRSSCPVHPMDSSGVLPQWQCFNKNKSKRKRNKAKYVSSTQYTTGPVLGDCMLTVESLTTVYG